MKNLVTLLVFFILATGLYGQGAGGSHLIVEQSTRKETILRLTLSDVVRKQVITPFGEAEVIALDGGTPLLEAGSPDLPKYTTSLLIPDSGSMEFEVLEAEYQDFEGSRIAPSKGNLLRKTDPATVPYEYGPVYERNAFYPNALMKAGDPFIFREARGQSFWFQPVQYNPQTRVLRVYTSLRVRIFHIDKAGLNEKPRVAASVAPGRSFEGLYRRLFVNYNRGFLWENRTTETPEKMLVLAADDLLPGLEAYLGWKRASGIHTTVVTASEVNAGNPEALYEFVKNYYGQHQISYLLVVGDEQAFAPMMRPGSNFSCEHCLGYMEGDDHYPEILVGRFHAANAEQLATMTARNLTYERTPLLDTTANWMATGMASTSDEGAGIGDDGQADYEQGNEWKSKHLEDGFERYWEFYDGSHMDISPTPGDESADQPGNPENTALVQLMNTRGVSLYNYTGHGWEQGLASGNFNTDAVANLRNNGRYPIIVAVACCAGNFTNNDGGDCLGEAMQRAGSGAAPWGGIGSYMSSDFQSWAPPMEGQDGMNQYLIDADGITLHPSLGGMGAFGNARMIEAYGQGGINMADVWNPFLDPTTVPRTRMPEPITASHDPSFSVGATSFVVASPVEGALAVLYQDEQTLAVATVINGQALLQFPPITSVSAMLLTLVQFNHLPYQQELVPGGIQGPYVISSGIQANDISGGNANAVVEYGEELAIDVRLANVGGQLAHSTQIFLNTNDDNVVILDGFEAVGDLDADSTTDISGAFRMRINPDVTDGYPVHCQMTIQFEGGEALEVPFSFQVSAPVLEVLAISVMDAAPGGDGDGYLESGETAEIRVGNINRGHSTSPAAISTLMSDTPWLSVSNPVSLGKMEVDSLVEAVFFVTVSLDAPEVVPAVFRYTLVADNYLADAESDLHIINPIIENFETHTFATFPWASGGNKPWVIAAGNAYSGIYAARSGPITHNQQSEMHLQLEVLQGGFVSFARRVNSEADYDFLGFFVDGVEVDRWSGVIPWGEVVYPITAGVHQLSWIYKKDEVGSQGLDRAWVDEILLPPYQVVVGTDELVGEAVEVYAFPNPFTELVEVVVRHASISDGSLSVMDVSGKLVRRHLINSGMGLDTGRFLLDTRGLKSGLYFIRMETPAFSRVFRVVKQ